MGYEIMGEIVVFTHFTHNYPRCGTKNKLFLSNGSIEKPVEFFTYKTADPKRDDICDAIFR